MSPEFQRIWDSTLALGAAGTIAAARPKRLHGSSKSGAPESFSRHLLVLESGERSGGHVRDANGRSSGAATLNCDVSESLKTCRRLC